MKTTVDEASVQVQAGPRRGWLAFITEHPDPGRIGLRLDIGVGTKAMLGRRCELFGAGALDASKISRTHLALEARPEACRITDLGSRNGTWVNGERVEGSTDVTEASRVQLGVVGLVVRPGPLDYPVPQDPVWWGRSPAAHDVVSALERLAPLEVPVTVTGPSGSGKSLVARELHRRSGRTGELVVINCGALDDDRLRQELFGTADVGLLARAADGTVVLDHLDDASDRLQRVLLDVLEFRAFRPVDSAHSQALSARFVATANRPLRALAPPLRSDFATRLGMVSVDLPPLVDHVEDVPVLALAFAEAISGAPQPMDVALLHALSRHPWHGDVRELRAFIEHLHLTYPDTGRLPLDETLAHLAPRLGPPPRARPTVARDGGWVEVEGVRQPLDRRPLLRRLLAALVEASLKLPPRALTVADLIAVGWPDEQILPEPGANRVYVALSQLRQLGLREVLVRDEGGYRLEGVDVA